MEEKQKNKSIVKPILKTIGAISGICLSGYVIHEVKKEYESTIKENNRLKEFINDHDFYMKSNSKPLSYYTGKDKESDLEKDKDYSEENSWEQVEWTDPSSGFKVLSWKKKTKGA